MAWATNPGGADGLLPSVVHSAVCAIAPGYPLCVRIPVHSAEAVCTRIPHSAPARQVACLHASVLLGAYVSAPPVACQPRGAYQACFIGSVPLGDDYHFTAIRLACQPSAVSGIYSQLLVLGVYRCPPDLAP